MWDLVIADGELSFFGGDRLDDNFVVQQFTGLFDKDNKDIYEGDIVSTVYPDENSIGEVYFDQDTCAYRILTKRLKLPIITARHIDGVFSSLVPVFDSVLGNVFEDKDLLPVTLK